jgi:hypothetical protein
LVGYKQYTHFAWVLTLAFVLLAPAFGRVETAEGTHFDIVGFDRRSVYFVEELSERILLEAERYLGDQPTSFPQRILVTLRPGDATPDAKDYRISTEPGGFVRLDFNWRKDLTYADLCRGMLDAYLTRYAIFHHGYEAPDNIKAWVVSALSRQTYLSLRPSVYLAWQRSLLEGEIPLAPSLTQTIKEARPDESSLSAFLLLMAVRNADYSRETVRGLCRAAVAGVDVVSRLTQLIQPSDPSLDAVTLPDWWKIQMAELITEPLVQFDSLADSSEWIKSLSEVENFTELAVEVKDLQSLWQFRAEDRVRQVVIIRLGQIMAQIDRVNPVYLNSVQSLGRLYEQLLKGNEEHAYIFDLAAFLGDLSDAQRLHKDIAAALAE